MKLLIPLLLLVPSFSSLAINNSKTSLSEEKERVIYFKEMYTPSDPYYNSSTIDGYTQKSIALNYVGGIESVWDHYKGSGVTIAVIDSGIDINHPDFDGKISNKSGYFYYDEYQGKVVQQIGKNYAMHNTTAANRSAHGSNVSGTAAAKNDSTGTIGIAPQATILALRVDFSSISLDKAIRYAADNGADVINMSLGMYAEPYYDGYEHKWYDEEDVDYYPGCETSLTSALNYAHNKGVILIAAAGNECTNVHSYPASNNYVIGVGALNYASGTQTAPFSNYNGSSDTSTSNCNVDVVTGGYVIAADYNFNSSSSSYCRTQGTSFSSPIVAGAAALWKEQNPDGTPDQFKTDLLASVDDIGSTGWDTQFGHGRLNIQNLMAQRQAADSISFSEASHNINVNESYKLNPTILPSGTYNVTYTSSNTNVATVNNNGMVTGLRAGSTVITAKVSNLTATITINVSDILITGINLTKTNVSLHIGESTSIGYSLLPANATEAVNVTTSNSNVYYSKSQGKIRGDYAGSSDVIFTSASGAVTAICHVEVSPVPVEVTLSVNPTSVIITNVGDTKAISVVVTVTPSSETVEVTRTSSDESIATINDSNVLTAKGVGSCTITIEAGDKSVDVSVVVLRERSPFTPKGLCGGNIYISSGVIVSAISLVAIILLKKKKKLSK